MRKNLKIYTTYTPWIINAIFGPIIWLGITFYAYVGIASPESIRAGFSRFFTSGDFTGFLILGQSVFSFFSAINWGAGFAIERERTLGTFELILLAPTSRVVIVLGEALFEALDSGWMVFLAAYVTSSILGTSFNLRNPTFILLSILLTMAAMLALGLFFAGFYVMTRSAHALAIGMLAPTRFFSGTSFPLSAMPIYLQYISYALPVTHGLNAVRRALLDDQMSFWSMALDLGYLTVFTLIFSVLGFWMIRKMESIAKQRGTLHTY